MVIKIAAKDKKLNIMYFTFLIIYKYIVMKGVY